MEFVKLTEHSNNKLVIIELERPQTKNAFNTQMARELIDSCKVISQLILESSIKVAIIKSTDSSAFCVGADLKERAFMSENEWNEQHKVFENMFHSLANLPIPVIASIDGYALAGGFEIALACDFIIATNTAVFGFPEVTRGIMPGGGATHLLPKKVGLQLSKEWIYSGRKITAEEADRAGLLSRLTTSDQLYEKTIEFATLFDNSAPIAMRNCKQAIDNLYGLEIEKARIKEIEYYNECINTTDRMEGILAFKEKRAPVFIGK